MPPNDAAIPGLALGLGMALVDLLLAVWLWRERRGRSDELSPEDRLHFARQDRRRGSVVFIVGILAAALVFGSRVPSVVGGKPNRLFLRIWILVIALLVVLFFIALIDWISTRFYARRRRLELIEEGVLLVQRERAAGTGVPSRSDGRNGRHDQDAV